MFRGSHGVRDSRPPSRYGSWSRSYERLDHHPDYTGNHIFIRFSYSYHTPSVKSKWRHNEHFKVYLSKNLLKSGTIQLLEMVRSLHWLELGDLLIEKRQKQSKEMNRLAVAQAITLFGKASEAICGQLSFSFYFFFLFVVICFWQTAVQFLFHNYELNSAIQLDGEGVRQSHSFCSSGFDFLTWVIYKLTFWIA